MLIFNRLRDYFIGDILHEDLDTIQHANVTMVYCVVILALCLLIPLQFLYLWIGNMTQLFIGVISIAVFFSSLILIKVKRSVTLIAHGMLIFSTAIFTLNIFMYPDTGVINGFMLGCNIIFAFNLFDRKTGGVYAAIHLIVGIGYMVLMEWHVPIAFIEPIHQPLFEKITTYIILFIMVVVLILHYQSAHKAAAVRLTKSINELKISEERRRKSQAIGHIGNWEYNLETKESYMDEESYRIFGIPTSKTRMTDFKESVHPDDWDKLVESMRPDAQKKFYDHEYRIFHLNGEERVITIVGELQNDTNGTPLRLYGIIQDITERKRAEVEQQRLMEITNNQNSKLKNFAYIVSHNIRSHSSNITSLVDFLIKSKSEGERAKIQEMLRNTAINLDDTLLELNEMITITENIAKPKTLVQLEQEIRKTLEVLSGPIFQHAIQVKVNVASDIFVHVIPSYCDSILLNVIGNAIKYRSLERICTIEISAEKMEGQVVLSVKDNGLGINLHKNASKIFGMYKTFHSNKDARGVGLFITKNHIEAMKGKIEVESEENVGSTFKIYFNERD